jgi:hypothetical protein
MRTLHTARRLGAGSYNDFREHLGLMRCKTYEEINPDKKVSSREASAIWARRTRPSHDVTSLTGFPVSTGALDSLISNSKRFSRPPQMSFATNCAMLSALIKNYRPFEASSLKSKRSHLSNCPRQHLGSASMSAPRKPDVLGCDMPF